MTKTEFLTNLFTCFNKQEIDYYVVGEYANLPVDCGDSDIDIYINPKHYSQVTEIIENLRRKNEIVLASFYKNPYESYIRLLTCKWGVQIDLQKTFLHKCQSYYNPNFFIDNIYVHNGIVRVLNTCEGYYVGFLKELIHTGQIKEKYVTGFIEEFKINPKRHHEIAKCLGKHTLELFERYNTKEELLCHTKELRASIISYIHSWDYIKRLYFFIYNLRRVLLPPGYVIVVLGTDGSGKSTIINRITPKLDEGFHHGVVYNHLRPNAIPELGVLLGKKEKQDASIVNTDPHALKQSGFFGSIIRWGYYMIDYTFGYMKVVWPQIRTKSKVYIFDRYYYDYYIDQKRSRISLPNWVIRMGEFFVPKPDLIICLGGNPKEVFERKPETSLKEVVRQTEALKEFCSNRDNAVWVDTTCPLELSVNSAMRAIVDMMSKRFEKTYIK